MLIGLFEYHYDFNLFKKIHFIYNLLLLDLNLFYSYSLPFTLYLSNRMGNLQFLIVITLKNNPFYIFLSHQNNLENFACL